MDLDIVRADFLFFEDDPDQDRLCFMLYVNPERAEAKLPQNLITIPREVLSAETEDDLVLDKQFLTNSCELHPGMNRVSLSFMETREVQSLPENVKWRCASVCQCDRSNLVGLVFCKDGNVLKYGKTR